MYAAGRQDRAGMAGDWQGTRATADTAATSHGFMHSSHQPPEMSMTVPEVEMMGPQRLELVPRHVEGTLSTLILEKGLFWKRYPRSLWGGGWQSGSPSSTCYKGDLSGHGSSCPWGGTPAGSAQQGTCYLHGQRNSTSPEAVCVSGAREPEGRPR